VSDALSIQVERRILLIRGQKVLLDYDLAELYGVETKALNRAGKRNIDRFPEDFMFQLTAEEWENLRYQIGTSSEEINSGAAHGGRRRPPYAFSEQGVGDAFERFEERPCCEGEHRDHANFCTRERITPIQRGPGLETRSAGKQI
jgi:hypothetical protein